VKPVMGRGGGHSQQLQGDDDGGGSGLPAGGDQQDGRHGDNGQPQVSSPSIRREIGHLQDFDGFPDRAGDGQSHKYGGGGHSAKKEGEGQRPPVFTASSQSGQQAQSGQGQGDDAQSERHVGVGGAGIERREPGQQLRQIGKPQKKGILVR
jgi:hypothetical protein